MERIILFLQQLCPDSIKFDDYIRQIVVESRESFHRNVKGAGKENVQSSAAATTFLFWWQIFMSSLLAAFFLSLISHFAQYYQMTLDQEDSNRLRKRLPQNIRAEIVSPQSGRLKLPPPTPLKKNREHSELKHRNIRVGTPVRTDANQPNSQVITPITSARKS